ncbi:MAG: 3,4-dihydroxy-2-butanone-4-phosphate synthase [Gammaproteobacteria bacterium]|nr:3,4-dihydroxy-2-butanone-4-phosphate synthase [Gammaproteobacteria bacterium]
MTFNTTLELIDEIRQGRMIILVDDEGRENEGDLIMASARVKDADINFMARYGRGLICLTLTEKRCRQLDLPQMVSRNTEAQGTRFTVSVDAARDITTGISAADRAHTINAAVAKDAMPQDLVQPGHIFPLMAEPGGVLTRAGHTEAGCDLARLAGFEPSATIVEVLNEDGTMARRPDLERFAAEHNLKIGTIADLIQYRMLNETTVERIGECAMPTVHGEFKMIAYRSTVSDALHFAMVKGHIDREAPVLIRVHVANPLIDLTGSIRGDGGWPLADALNRIEHEGAGVVVVLRHRQPNKVLAEQFARFVAADGSHSQPAANDEQDSPGDLRTYGVGAQILLDLGVRRMRVLSAPKRMHAISGFGLEVAEYVGQ